MSPEAWITSVVGAIAILGGVLHWLRTAWKAVREFIDTMGALRDLTEQFVRNLAEDERRFQRIENQLGLPPWRDGI